jgi:hypothetical protein
MAIDGFRDFREVERHIGANGVPSRMLAGEATIAEAIDALAGVGCGAWVGRTACGKPASAVLVGSPWLVFATYRCVHSADVPAIAVVCDRHASSRQALIGDTPKAIRRDQEREHTRFCRLREFADDKGVIVLSLDDCR